MTYLFLFALNLTFAAVIGFLTLDSEANLNSRVGGILVSFLLPLVILFLTPTMSGLERLLKFGTGFILYFIMTMIIQGFVVGFITTLFPCLLIAIVVLYYGGVISLEKLTK